MRSTLIFTFYQSIIIYRYCMAKSWAEGWPIEAIKLLVGPSCECDHPLAAEVASCLV